MPQFWHNVCRKNLLTSKTLNTDTNADTDEDTNTDTNADTDEDTNTDTNDNENWKLKRKPLMSFALSLITCNL